MTPLKAAECLRAHFEELDPHNEVSITVTPAELVQRLIGASEDIEEFQARGIAEWQELIDQTDDPLAGGQLMLEWFLDYVQARVDAADFRHWERQPDDQRQPWSDGRVP